MLMQPAVWAIIINNFTFHYAFYVVMNWLPTYFDKVCALLMHFHICGTGLLQAAALTMVQTLC